jgi:hypothetical protein
VWACVFSILARPVFALCNVALRQDGIGTGGRRTKISWNSGLKKTVNQEPGAKSKQYIIKSLEVSHSQLGHNS